MERRVRTLMVGVILVGLGAMLQGSPAVFAKAPLRARAQWAEPSGATRL